MSTRSNEGQELVKVEDWTPYVLGEQRLPIEDPEDIQRSIQESILNATNIDDVLAAGETMPVDELIGVPLMFHGAELRSSRFGSGPGVYCFIKCEALETGERFTVTCGGLKVVTKLWQAYRVGAYPFEGMFTSKPTAEGNTVKSITSLPERRSAIEATVVEEV